MDLDASPSGAVMEAELATTSGDTVVTAAKEALFAEERDEVKLLLEAIDATRHASGLWIKLLRPYLSWLFRSARASLSSGFTYTKRKFFELDEDTQKSILASFVVLLGLLAVKRLVERSRLFPYLRKKYDLHVARLRLAWLRVNKRIGKTSKVLADLLPHLVLVAIFGLYLGVVPSHVRNTLESPLVYLVVGKLYPVVWSADACVRGSTGLPRLLQLWVAFYIMEVLAEVPLLVPFLSPLMRYTAYDLLRASRLFVALWIALPFTDGARQICASLSPPLRPTRSQADRARRRGELTTWLLDTAGRVGVIRLPAAMKTFATDLVSHWVHLLTLPFLFTPGFITYYGGILSGKVFPIRASLRAQAGASVEEVRYWTVYWVVFCCLDCAHHVVTIFVGWVPLWQHLKLAGIFWLQFPYFRGANTVFASLDEKMVITACSYFKMPKVVPKLKALKKTKTNEKAAKGGAEKED